jgi:hypothetical protein
MWEIDLTERVEFLRTRSAPTVDLRYEHLFTPRLESRVVPSLIDHAWQKIREDESKARTRSK